MDRHCSNRVLHIELGGLHVAIAEIRQHEICRVQHSGFISGSDNTIAIRTDRPDDLPALAAQFMRSGFSLLNFGDFRLPLGKRR